MNSTEKHFPVQAIETAERMSRSDIESLVAIFDGAESGDKKGPEVIREYLDYHPDMFGAYDRLRWFALLGCFEGGEFDLDQEDRVLQLSEKGRELQKAAHDLLEVKTRRRVL